MKKLTKKQIDEYCRTVIYHLISTYDTTALEGSGLSLDDEQRIMVRMEEYARKYITDHVVSQYTNAILDSVRNSAKK